MNDTMARRQSRRLRGLAPPPTPVPSTSFGSSMPEGLLNKKVQAIYIDIINVGEMVALNDDEQAIIDFYDMIRNHAEIRVEFARTEAFGLEGFRMGQTIDSSVLGEMGTDSMQQESQTGSHTMNASRLLRFLWPPE